jgi:hypothetical protein
MFQVLCFQMYVASVSYVCYKCRSGWCIEVCCNSYTPIFQVYVPNVSFIFRHMLQVFHLGKRHDRRLGEARRHR